MTSTHLHKSILMTVGALALAVPVFAAPGAGLKDPRSDTTWGGPAALALDAGQDADRQDREREQRDREREQRDREREREAGAYDQGQEALDSGRWDRAVASFDRVAALKGTKADAALYWKSYAQFKLGQRTEALSTIAELTKSYPKSRYLEQAKALEVDVRKGTGSPSRPEDQSDEELKLFALNALQNSSPEEAIPVLQKMLQGTASPRVKAQALFVLAQSSAPAARQIIVNIAKGSSMPDLQSKAIQYLGIHGGRENRAALGDIYSTTSDVDVKRRILRAFMVAGEKDRLLTAAQSEQNPELRAEAVRQLGVMSAHDELWTLYQKESSIDVKKQILQAMFVGGNATRLIDLAKGEKNPELRRTAVRNLGLMGGKQTGDALVDIYNSDKDPDVRQAVIQALFIQNNGDALVALARKEQDHDMKMQIVQKLSLIGNSKAAKDYLLELLNK